VRRAKNHLAGFLSFDFLLLFFQSKEIMVRQKNGFSLVELVIIVIFLGIIAGIAVPRFNFAIITKQDAEATAWKIVTDLRRTRSLAIDNAADNTAGFALNMTGSAPYSGYQIQNLATSATVDSHSIDSDTSCTGSNQFRFGPLGNLLSGSGTQLVVSASGKTFTINLTTATGLVRCVEN
jgi:Tfp pilus assembly protein FimT